MQTWNTGRATAYDAVIGAVAAALRNFIVRRLAGPEIQ
jgi:hypothetical protein